MILNQQVNKLMASVSTDMVNGQSGTSSVLFVKTQTALITAVGATELTLSDKTNSSSSVSVTHIITISVGNGSTLTEFEVNDGAGVSYNRVVKAGIAKDAQTEYNIFHTFTFEVVV